MDKKLIVSAILLAMLAACSSNTVKEQPTAPAAVSDMSSGSANDAANNSSASTDGAQASSVAVNPLKDPNNILSKRTIYFDFDKDEVKSEYRALVEAHGKYVAEHGDAKVTLQGGADNRGSREYNLSLGQRRAVSVKKAMNLSGAPDARIETISYGEERAHDCKDESCFQEDRRVDIVYDGE
jgi:peptidoglycan-associated lipoprotein